MGSAELSGAEQESHRVPTVRPERDHLASFRDEQLRIKESLLDAAARLNEGKTVIQAEAAETAGPDKTVLDLGAIASGDVRQDI